MPELMIFKAGKYPQGDWPKERVQKMVDAYDSEKKPEAPVVIGHRYWGDSDEYQFAHGWVKGLRMDGAGKVYADIPEFSAEIKKAMAENKLRYISAEIYELDKADSAQTPYLRAVALLGRDSPAIPAARLPTPFGFMDSGALIEINEPEHIIAFTRRVSTKEIQTLSIEETNHKEDSTMDKTEELQAELKKKEEMLAAFKKENNELKLAGKKAESEAYFEKLRDEGKLPPAVFKQAVDFDVQLDSEAQKEFRAFFEQAKPILDFSGKHIADKKIAQTQGASGFSLAARIRAFQKERNLSSFTDAAEILHAENPALFAEEGTP
jgi:hypothetical protein